MFNSIPSVWHVDKDGSMEKLDFDFGVHKNHPTSLVQCYVHVGATISHLLANLLANYLKVNNISCHFTTINKNISDVIVLTFSCFFFRNLFTFRKFPKLQLNSWDYKIHTNRIGHS